MRKKQTTLNTAPTMQAAAVNPFSTGGGGAVFESKIQSGLFAMLLVQGSDPIFPSCHIRELHLQTGHKGFRTDDALAVSVDPKGQSRKALWSMKHEVRFTKGDTVFADVVADAWLDFTNSAEFDPRADAIVLATVPLTATQKHFRTLLEWARASIDAADFSNRIAQTNYASEDARKYLAVVRELSTAAAHSAVTDEQIWQFLRCFHVLTYDVDSAASQDEARFKTILELAARPGSNQNGETLWNTICKYVADLNPRAGSFTRENLPRSLTDDCATVAGYFAGGVHRLREHAEGHLSRIRTTLGPKIAVPRAKLVDEIASNLRENQFTLVTGFAGTGKSAAAILALRSAQGSHPLFVFQAMEFARNHLDQALAELRIPETISQLSALFALHDRKFLLIESLEKLLEAEEREAFAMLLEAVAKDSTWHILMTCRQHAARMVQDAFLAPLGLSVAKVEVPSLDDGELQQVLANVPNLQTLASNSRIRSLLRNPWYLDKACNIEWETEKAQPVDEPQLREILWRHIVARDDHRYDGLHRQRDACFRSIAIKCAKSLRSFVQVDSGYEAATQALVADELLVEEVGTGNVAPAHDVLEDWALIRWIEEQFAVSGDRPSEFFKALGHELPIRRSFRQWLTEALADVRKDDARRFVGSTVSNTSIEDYWRDETLVSILVSKEGPTFIQSEEAFLLADGKQQLMRLLHLLRIACKAPNPLLRLDESKLGTLFGDHHLIPQGGSWGEALRLIHRRLAEFAMEEMPLVVGVLQDWKSSIHWRNPTPDGAREAGFIALHYWELAEARGSWRRDLWEQLVELLLAAPQAIAEEFKALVTSVTKHEERHAGDEQLKKGLLASINAWPACRFLPDVVVELAEYAWGLRQPPKPDSRFSDSSNIDGRFGLSTGFSLDYYPASALHGPFYPLLQGNPLIGMALLLKLANVATERFVANGMDARYGDAPYELDVRLDDSTLRRQWANARLWMMYRGSIPGPNVLESALMALEKWLLDLAETEDDLQPLAFSILKQSNNVAVTSVIASVTMAHPGKFSDVAITLLRMPEFFEWDRARWAHDQTPLSAIPSIFPGLAKNRIYEQERADSDKLAHRACNFEWLAQTLQTGKSRDAVWKVIDEHKAALPQPEAQSADDKRGRLVLHRIDLRNYRPDQKLEDGRVTFVASPPEPDLAAMIEKATPHIQAANEAAALLVWGIAVFERRDADKHDPNRWREMLSQAQEAVRQNNKDLQLAYGGGPGYVTAVCVRDHWTELAAKERTWCRKYLVRLVAREKDKDDDMLSLTEGPMGGAQPAALIMPLLLRDASVTQRRAVREALASALTHTVEQIRNFAARGARLYLWDLDSDLALACVAGLVDYAEVQRRNDARERRLPWQKRKDRSCRVRPAVHRVRARIATVHPLSPTGLVRLSLNDPFSCQVWPLILCIFADRRDDSVAHRFFAHVAMTLVRSWDRKKSRSEWRNDQAESAVQRVFAQFALRCTPDAAAKLWKTFADAIPKHAEKLSRVFEHLIYAEDQQRSGETFWRLWKETADRVVAVPEKIELMLGDHSGLAKLASVLLFDHIYWKEGAKDWEPLQGHERDLADFFTATGSSPSVFQSFISVLDSVGNKQLLPEALCWLADHLRTADAQAMIGNRNTLFLFARILTPMIYGRTSNARKSPYLRDAILLILDAMVNAGSSAAFRMREFFITPESPPAPQSFARVPTGI